ncbi:type I restriction enzyme endonuclease domain-containing protein, partial [Staphylococcus haemolyticus]|uniref:type I restriction enzyme endonuclease domain-containing protein n=1 Tax=Staphylococcus haemolyticus TaxID=1283 RepID=UPI0011A66FF7
QPFIKTLTQFPKPFALSPTQPTPQQLNHQIPFFKPLKPPLLKFLQPPKQPKTPKTPPQLQPHINQLLSQSLLTEHVIHLYQTLPLQQPHLSILSD